MLETMSLHDIAITDVAGATGISRPAIYRRWASVEEIVLDAFLHETQDAVPMPEGPDVAEVLRLYILSLVRFIDGRVGRTIAELLGMAQSNPQVFDAFHARFLTERRDHGRQIILRGQRDGVFRDDLDSELVIDLYAGPIYFRAFSRHGPLDDAFAQGLADRVLAAIRV